MSCAHWWESTELYQNLIDTRRQSELEYRTLIVAITKMQKENLVPTSISFEFLLTMIKELLVPNLTTTFPCKKENLGAWLTRSVNGEYPSTWREGNASTHELFGETDYEDGTRVKYTLTTDPNASFAFEDACDY